MPPGNPCLTLQTGNFYFGTSGHYSSGTNTNPKTTPRHIYEAGYCARGDAENRLKELKLGLEIDRTNCTSFLANQFRVLMTAAAYVLMQELRLRARRTGCARAQVATLRLRLLKLGAWIESSVRRGVIHLPIGTPFADDWRRIARSVGAVVTLNRSSRPVRRTDPPSGVALASNPAMGSMAAQNPELQVRQRDFRSEIIPFHAKPVRPVPTRPLQSTFVNRSG